MTIPAVAYSTHTAIDPGASISPLLRQNGIRTVILDHVVTSLGRQSAAGFFPKVTRRLAIYKSSMALKSPAAGEILEVVFHRSGFAQRLLGVRKADRP